MAEAAPLDQPLAAASKMLFQRSKSMIDARLKKYRLYPDINFIELTLSILIGN